ncbi:MAG: hypothetical protein AAFN77_12245 [Planctomycetota bacterium]
MPIRVTCTKCHTRFNVSEKFAGKEGPCPKCKTVIKVPTLEEQVVIAAPKPKGPVDSTGKSVLKPIRRKETKLSSVQITLIVCSIVVFLIVALVLRMVFKTPAEFPLWLLCISSVVLAVPLVFVAYAFLRDQEREGFWGNDLWSRVGICSVVYAITWAALPLASFAFNDSYETGSYVTAGIAMFVIGTIASIACFDFDWLIGSVHFGLYMGVGLLGRFLAGIHVLPVNMPGSQPTTTTTTTTTTSSLIQTLESMSDQVGACSIELLGHAHAICQFEVLMLLGWG